MPQAFRRLVRSVVGRFTSPVSLSKRALRRPLEFTALEERVVPALASLPDRLLPVGFAALSVKLGDLNFDGRADLVAVARDGTLAVALNRGDDVWTKLTAAASGVGAVAGTALGQTDTDPYPDLVLQTAGGVTVAAGDGSGRFGHYVDFALGAPGSFAAPAGLRVDPVVAPLAGSVFAGVVAVAPGTSEVAVLRRAADGRGFLPAARFPSGGGTPVAVAVGRLVGDDLPDLAVGHRDGAVTLFEGKPDGTFLPRPDLTVTGLGAVTGLAAADVTGDGEPDLVVSGTDRVTVLRNAATSTYAGVIANGDFARGLTGWAVASGTVTGGGGSAQFREHATALLSSLQQTFTVPAGAAELSFDLTAALEAAGGGVPDAFEASLLGPDGRPLLPSFRADASSFFNMNPGGAVAGGPNTAFDGRRVRQSLSGVPAGTRATLAAGWRNSGMH